MLRLGNVTLGLGSSAMEPEPGIRTPVWRSRLGGALGLLSAGLLVASFIWAHHWGLVADSLVAGWALATIGAAVISIWSLRTSRIERGLARLGLACALVSVLALAAVGVLFAAGSDPAGTCGGG